ncbi:MAG: dUTP pyrophosphatase [Clostridia bacterium]
MTIKFARLFDDVKLPTKRAEDAGFDIYARFDDDFITISPHQTYMFKTGIISAFSKDYVAIIKERGSTGTRGLGQRSGVIDSGYRGEWLIPLTNHNDVPFVVAKNINQNFGDAIVYPYDKAICQCLILELPDVQIEPVSVSDIQSIASTRGDGNLGSSGK